MAVNFSSLVLLTNYDFWGRPVTVTPIRSQPGAPAYDARGIYDSGATEVLGEDVALISDQRTRLDIMEVEFAVLPQQGDIINIPEDDAGNPALGDFEITDATSDGGGETTLTIRRWETAAP